MKKKVTLCFTALDTWFFRESRPMDAIGAELGGVFPPPPRTLLGALRTAIGEAAGVDWRDFRDKTAHPLRATIGYGDDLGPITLNSGPWLTQDGERLYPVPRYLLLAKDKDKTMKFVRLRIGCAVGTHLGRVRLPELPADEQGYKPLEGAWLTCAGLQKVLAGEMPTHEDLRYAHQLFQEEARLGIARDNQRRTAVAGMLHHTRHLRPRPGLAIEVDVTLAPDTETEQLSGMVRLGGEGRLAHLAVRSPPETCLGIPDLASAKDTQTLIVTLLTPARFQNEGKPDWLPAGFTLHDRTDGIRVWKGAINGVDLTLHAAILGKAQREGGWDMARHQPRAVQSFIPAGSSYYFTVAGDRGGALKKLHNAQIGEDQAIGRGLMVCGLCHGNEFTL